MYVKSLSVLCCLCLCSLAASKSVQPNASATAALPAPAASTVSVNWMMQLKDLRQELRNCYQAQQRLWHCFKAKSLHILERALHADEIPIYAGVRLIRATHEPQEAKSMQDASYSDHSDMRKDLKHHTWFDKLALSLARTLRTHTLQINLAQVTDAYMRASERSGHIAQTATSDAVGTARVRRHRYNMIITMMFGVTALGAVLVPMGFQMLSIVSGKALLLAKMALLLASINGLKRVANSGLHYGLYHVPGEHYGGYFDRGDVNHPRNVPIPMALAQPVDMSLTK